MQEIKRTGNEDLCRFASDYACSEIMKMCEIFMSKTASFSTSISTFSQDFFQTLIEEVHRAENQRACPEVSDIEWMTSGVSRALDVHHSGRGFLQNQKARGVKTPEGSLFFESLKSKRRLTLSAEVCLAVSKRPQAPRGERCPNLRS